MDSNILKRQLLYSRFYSWGECKRRYGSGHIEHVIVRLCQDFMENREMLMIGNMVMYQITRAYDDSYPEEGAYVNYIEEIREEFEDDIHWKCTLVCIMLLLDLQVALPDKITAFLSQLRSLTIDIDFCRSEFGIISEEMEGTTLNIDYSPCPVVPKGLLTDKYNNSWKMVTDNFYQPTILKILSRYKSKKDQRLILKMIKSEFRKSEVSDDEFINTVQRHLDGNTSHFKRTDEDFFKKTEEALDAAIKKDVSLTTPHQNSLFMKLKDLFTFRPAFTFDTVGNPSFTIDYGPSPEVLELRQSLSRSCAKEDMLAQENALLKQQMAELTLGKDEIQATERKKDVELPEMVKDVNFDSVVDAALASHDIKFVRDVLTLLYKLTGRVLSVHKDRRLNELEVWHDELHMRQGGINIENLNQYGGIISETINTELRNNKV